jgi:hypothetical protein
MNEEEKDKLVREICKKILTYANTGFEAIEIAHRVHTLVSHFFLARYIYEQLKGKEVDI